MASRSRTDTATTAATTAAGTTTTEPKTRKRGRGAASVSEAAEAVEVNCLMNARYHSGREAFLDATHRWFMFCVVAAGAGAVTGVLDTIPYSQALLGCIAALLGAADLAFDLSNRAKSHALMKRRYFELLADMREGRKTPADVEACSHRYSADEEPAFHALLMSAWNAAQCMVYGNDAQKAHIPRHHRWLQNVWRFEGRTYQ